MSTSPAPVRHLIDGAWVGDPILERRNPADADDVVSLTASGSSADVESALDAARRASAGWADTPAPRRGAVLARAGQLLRERIEVVARDLTREEGKTLGEATGEVHRAADILEYAGGTGWRLTGESFSDNSPGAHVYTVRQPVGVVAVITPWNFPLAIPTWKIAPALVCGNSVVLKPASHCTLSAMHLATALADAGLPAGVLNVVFGDGATIGDALTGSPSVDAVTFTGSSAVGRRIYDATSQRMVRTQLEMGGKNALVVLDDADPAAAARVAAAGAFGLTGQACTATSRVVVTPKIVEPLIAALRDEASRFAPGNGLTAGVLMGPVVSESQLAVDTRYVGYAVEDGGEVVFGGAAGEHLNFPPTLIRNVRSNQRVARDEIFGPVVSLIEVADFDEAMEVTADSKFGLTAGICTNDLRLAHEFARRVPAGVVKVNRPTTGLDLNVPFGGIRDSSTGTFREQGSSAIEFFTWSKSVYLGWGPG